jgi:hypothetical protein
VTNRRLVRSVTGWSAVAFSALYLLSDVIEAAQGGFSTAQLWLTLVAEAPIPLLVFGLWTAQRPRIGHLGLTGAAAYATVYVFFAWTVIHALSERTPDFDVLTADVAPWMTVGGGVMVIAGLALGIATLRAGVVDAWGPRLFMVGVVAVALTSGMPEALQLPAAAARDAGFAAIGALLALGPRPHRVVPAAGLTVHVSGPRPTAPQLITELRDAAAATGLAMIAPVLRPWHSRWGATDAEVMAAMPGDEIVANCQVQWTRAISIAAPPHAVWPWLAQVGFGRAGFYSNDLLDNAGHPSASEVHPELQELEVGDWIPMFSKVDTTTAFRVHSFEPHHSLVWAKPDSTWTWTLTADQNEGTRLVTRLRQHYDWHHPPAALISKLLMEFGDFPMIRRMLIGIKRRAEQHPSHVAGTEATHDEILAWIHERTRDTGENPCDLLNRGGNAPVGPSPTRSEPSR